MAYVTQLPTKEDSLLSRRVLITGVSRGLGHAMAQEFIRLGHVVVGCSRSEDHVAEMQARFPSPHRFDVVDVSEDGAVKDWAVRVFYSWGVPDLLINNAALVNHPAPLWDVPVDEFDRLIDVNIKGVANVLRHFVPTMKEQHHGIIVNFSSGWGRSTSPDVAPYCTSKWAIEGLTRALAQELPKTMAAISLNPGIIDTDMLRISFGNDAGSYPSPREWARTAVPFLLGITPRDNGKPLTIG